MIYKHHALVSAAFAGLPAAVLLLVATSAQGQFRVGADGHLNDANNRAGSAGYNTATDASNRGALNNNIVTGNVGGLSYFHGNTNGEFDSNVFQGNTGNTPSNFLNSISAPQNSAARNTGQSNVTPYYNTSNYIGGSNNVPLVSTANGSGLIPAPQVAPLTPNSDSRLQETSLDPTVDTLAAPGETNMAGPVDPSGRQSLYSMSPLYGVRQNDDSTDNSFFNSRTTDSRAGSPTDRNRMNSTTLQQMRDELNKTASPDDQSGQSPDSTKTPGAVNLAKGAQLNAPGGDISSKLSGSTAIDGTMNTQQMTGDLNSGQGVQNKLMVAPGKQSKQLAELERRFAQNKGKLTDVQASEQLNAEMRALKAPAKPAAGGDVTSKGAGGNIEDLAIKPAIGMPAETKAPRVAPKPVLPTPGDSQIDNTPYVVTSLASGIQAKGLADLMKSAEEQMRAGKFIEAVDTYQTAQQVAPNNPFIPLGRSFAELGASYYGKADLDLNRAITADPAILVGQYDLKGFIGEDRLTFVQKDLEDIAAHEKGARPVVLLAFIAHNTGNNTAAAKYLDEATTRGGYNNLIDQMRPAWGIKAAGQ